jgi:hypothetical protein
MAFLAESSWEGVPDGEDGNEDHNRESSRSQGSRAGTNSVQGG